MPLLRVLTLNLHCWQEDDADVKLQRIAAAIATHDIDVVCLQEVGQHVEAPVVGNRHGADIRADNAALRIVELLAERGSRYDWAWAFSHIGFDVWEEGIALISRAPLTNVRTPFISNASSPASPHSRVVVIADVTPADAVPVIVVSAHLSWLDHPDEPFAQQWQRLQRELSDCPDLVILAGDLNVRDDGPGYELMMSSGEWVDAHRVGCAPALPEGTFPDVGDHAGPAGRIDYVLTRGAQLEPVAAQVLFDDEPVSDHRGLLVNLDLRDDRVARHDSIRA